MAPAAPSTGGPGPLARAMAGTWREGAGAGLHPLLPSSGPFAAAPAASGDSEGVSRTCCDSQPLPSYFSRSGFSQSPVRLRDDGGPLFPVQQAGSLRCTGSRWGPGTPASVLSVADSGDLSVPLQLHFRVAFRARRVTCSASWCLSPNFKQMTSLKPPDVTRSSGSSPVSTTKGAVASLGSVLLSTRRVTSPCTRWDRTLGPLVTSLDADVDEQGQLLNEWMTETRWGWCQHRGTVCVQDTCLGIGAAHVCGPGPGVGSGGSWWLRCVTGVRGWKQQGGCNSRNLPDGVPSLVRGSAHEESPVQASVPGL